jgi:hypothetical protein
VVLSKPEIKLHTYTAQPISVMGKTLVSVEHLDFKGEQVVNDKSATLLGHEWLEQIKLDSASMKAVHKMGEILHNYAEVFRDTSGTMTTH